VSDPARVIVGYCLVWERFTPGVPVGIRYGFDRHSLDNFVASGMGVPLRLAHEDTWERGYFDEASRWVGGRMLRQVGACRRWHGDDYGLLTLAEVGPGPLGDTILQAVQRGELWGLSGGYANLLTDPPDAMPHPDRFVAAVAPRDVRVLAATVSEVSLTSEPSDPHSRVLAVGAEAAWVWERRDLLAAVAASQSRGAPA
jgi:hypothetical protein